MQPNYKEKIDKLLYSKTDESSIRLPLLEALWHGARFEKALDVGSGPGTLTQCLAKRTRQLTIVESNNEYEVTLREQFPSAKLVICSIDDYDLGQSTWDQILLSHVLYYFDETRWLPLCTRLHSALSAGGDLVVVINADRGEHWELLTSFRTIFGGALNFGLLPSSHFRQSLETLGPITFTPYTYHIFYNSIDDAVDFIGRQLLEIRDEHLLRRHRSKFEAAALERLRDNRVVFTFEADIIRVRR